MAGGAGEGESRLKAAAGGVLTFGTLKKKIVLFLPRRRIIATTTTPE
jgi:hypothetical protein